ncbi:Hypothetical predicted protein [Paramuricea clavata]|uniref:Uncharacterized protein n=1 Tax=Paramuricea clavata TaxID=317549 RepID=A0A6S7GV47_PARCT|nr:Hypothetical predicted protein [Paramuricea clavata]
MNHVSKNQADGTFKNYYDGFTKTFYFETFVGEPKLNALLVKYLFESDLSYYQYLSYPVADEKKQKWVKTIGVLQFNKRLAKSVVQRMFVGNNVFIDVLLPSMKPTILVLMKIYVIGERHGLTWDATKSSNTPFVFGGPTTTCEAHYLKPYTKALTLYRD